MSTFGMWHGAWCRDRLTPELEALGHRVIVMDLPIDDSAASFDDHAGVVCAEDRMVIPEWSCRIAREWLQAASSNWPEVTRLSCPGRKIWRSC